jgi:HAD superfamily hydrolase (TIGR01509 family)
MKKIKAIFWDNDGVLVDTERLYFEANRVVFAKHGINLTNELFVENFLKKGRGTWHLLKDKNYTEEMISELRNERNAYYSKLLEEQSEPIEGVEEVLQYLHGKIMMGVVTSSRKDHFEKIHSRTGFTKYFDFVLTSDDIDKVKPDPGPYLKALKISGFNKEDCIVVEDSERGLKAAVAAGLRCYIIPTELTKKSNFYDAEKILNSINDLVVIIS